MIRSGILDARSAREGRNYKSMPRIGAVALLLFALDGIAGAAWECQTLHFRAISEANPEIAAVAAEHLEAVRRRFAGLGLPPGSGEKGPTLVLVLADRASLDPYSPPDSRDPALTRGLSLVGAEQNWIAIAWDAPGSPLTALAHEYAHLAGPDATAPLWFREGLAEYLAGLGTGEGPTWPPPLHHLQPLSEQPWTPWDEFIAAGRMSVAFAQPNFYSQAWLAVHWLAAQGIAPAQLEPEGLESLVRTRGNQWVDEQLRQHAAQLWSATSLRREPQTKTAAETNEANDLPQTRPAEAWELPFWKAEFHRQLDHRGQAQPALELLERQYPGVPEPSEALAAIAIAEGRYDLAEEKLRNALSKGSQRPSTHYHYSLMLLRPVDDLKVSDRPRAAAEDRVEEAVSHARRAREAEPRQPRYLLGEAQALVVAGMWDAAAERLLDLQAFDGWRERSEQEFAELLRRRQQTLRGVPAPDGIAEAPSSRAIEPDRLAAAAWNRATPEVPPPPAPPNPEPQPWPPPGTVLLYGYINGVECRRETKIVTVKTPRYTIELREPAASPAKLYHPPKKWAELPCGLSGYEVNVVYRPLPAGGAVRGELVAVVF